MTFVTSILQQIPELEKPRFSFLLALATALSSFVGRATFANLARFGAGSSRRIERWFLKDFDWFDLQRTALEHTGVLAQCTACVFDPTFLEKSGKQTWGLDSFHDGCLGRPRRGLEAGVFALLDTTERTAYALEVHQTPAACDLEEGHSRIDFYLQKALELAPRLLSLGIRHLVVDGGLAKKKFVAGLRSSGLEVVGKLRKDAHLRYLYTGAQRTGPGRPRLYDGKVDWDDLSRFELAQRLPCGVELWECVVNSPCFGCNLKVVVARHGRGKQRILYSTDLELSALEILKLYQARFQVEFLIRDAKQFTGFEDGQMRDQKKRHNHLNASMWVLNLLRLEDRAEQNREGPRVISIDSLKRRKFNESFLDRIFSRLGLDPESRKIQPLYAELRDHGVRAA